MVVHQWMNVSRLCHHFLQEIRKQLEDYKSTLGKASRFGLGPATGFNDKFVACLFFQLRKIEAKCKHHADRLGNSILKKIIIFQQLSWLWQCKYRPVPKIIFQKDFSDMSLIQKAMLAQFCERVHQRETRKIKLRELNIANVWQFTGRTSEGHFLHI